MFLRGGHLYVYRSYGIHWCANIVTGSSGSGQAVLLRGGDVIEGAAIAVARRGRATNLANGPGKLAQAAGIHGGHDGLWLGDGPIRLEAGRPVGGYVVTPRIGISRGVEMLARFVADG